MERLIDGKGSLNSSKITSLGMLLSPEPDPYFLFLFFKIDGVLLPSLFEFTLLFSSNRLLNFTLFVDDETFSSLKFISLIFSVTCKLVALVSNSE